MKPSRRPMFSAAFAVLVWYARTADAQPIANDALPAVPEAPIAGPEASAGETVTFDRAVERALERNPTAQEASARIRRFRALMEEVRAGSLPSVTAGATYTRLDGDRAAGGELLESASSVNVAPSISVPLVNARGWTQWQQANDAVDVARAAADDVRRTLAVETARAYLSVLTQKRLLETLATARDDARAHYDFTRTQRLGGVGNTLDEARAAQELTTEDALLQSQEVALLRAREALGVLVAADGPIDATEWTFGEMPSLTEAVSEASRSRADVRERKRAAQAADRRVGQAYADYLPYLTLVASSFYQSVPVPTLPQTGWQAQLVLTLPLYDGGLRYGQEHERKAIADEAHSEIEAAVRQAKSDARTAFEELRRADVALERAHQAASFAAKAFDLATLAYRGGATSNLEVIDAEREQRDTRTQVAIAEDAARQARLDLLAASGRFPLLPGHDP